MEIIILIIIALIEFDWPYVLAGCAVLAAIEAAPYLIKRRKRRRISRINERMVRFRKENAGQADLTSFLHEIEGQGTYEKRFSDLCVRYEQHRKSLRKEAEKINLKAEKAGMTYRLRIQG